MPSLKLERPCLCWSDMIQFSPLQYISCFFEIPSGNLTYLWKITIFNGEIHYKWPFLNFSSYVKLPEGNKPIPQLFNFPVPRTAKPCGRAVVGQISWPAAMSQCLCANSQPFKEATGRP